jgi:hypothetical protein
MLIHNQGILHLEAPCLPGSAQLVTREDASAVRMADMLSPPSCTAPADETVALFPELVDSHQFYSARALTCNPFAGGQTGLAAVLLRLV